MAKKQKKCIEACMDLLVRREYSAKELKQKMLAKKKYTELDIEESISYLAEKGLQSDERYAEVFVRSYLERGHGPLLIRARLIEKGVSEDIIDEKIKEYEHLIPQVLEKLINKRDPEGKRHSDPRFRAKQARYLASKGFSYGDIEFCLSKRTQ